MTAERVLLSIEAGLATLTLNRGDASNALDRPMKEQLLAAVRTVAGDGSLRAVLLTADGDNFCVGQDLAEHAAALDVDPAHAFDTVAEHYNPLIMALTSIEVPVVAALAGACVGAGMGIALAADIRVAGEGTKFATAFTGIGLASDSGLSRSLVAAVGASRASGLMLLGDRFSAAQAMDWGLVHRVVPDAELTATACELAQRLAAGPTMALCHVKALLAATSAMPEALESERLAQVALGATDDHRNAVAAFLAKEHPTFTGQ